MAFFGLVAFTTNAQNCSAKKAKSASIEKTSCSSSAAAKLAAMDDSIEEKVCSTSGKVSYVKKSVCQSSGKVSLTDVEYCSKSAKFINVSPSKGKSDCAKSCAKAAKAKGAKATKASYNAKATSAKKDCSKSCAKACTAAEKAACATKKNCDPAACAGKKAKSASVESPAKVKLVKNEK